MGVHHPLVSDVQQWVRARMPDASHEADPPAASRRLGGKGLLDANATRGELARRVKIVAQRLSRLKQVRRGFLGPRASLQKPDLGGWG